MFDEALLDALALVFVEAAVDALIAELDQPQERATLRQLAQGRSAA